MKYLARAMAIGMAGALLVTAAWAAEAPPAPPPARVKLALKHLLNGPCKSDAGKTKCSKGVAEVGKALMTRLKARLADAPIYCEGGAKVDKLSMSWRHDEGAPAIDDTAAAAKGPKCVFEMFVNVANDEWPPIHYAAKEKDPSVDMTYTFTFALSLESIAPGS